MSLNNIEPHSESWKKILRQNFTRLDILTDFLELNEEQKNSLIDKPHFSLNIPLRLAQKIKKGTLDDPIFRQFVPLKEESSIRDDFFSDPVGDAQFCRESKLLHKYEGRVLLVCTSACAMHCRYCFRQNFDYDNQDRTFKSELNIIANDSTIREVILSGGDPLSLSNEILKPLLTKLNDIPHIKRIRFHTRFPIGIPERIDANFLSILENLQKQIWFVIHVNHPQELDLDIFFYLKKLQLIGCILLNQSVLLKNVNDNPDTLKELCEVLVDQGILPYYIHQLDRVKGTSHFEVSEEYGRELLKQISRSLPGYAVPKYVKEIIGESYKTSLF
ncbi:MAG: KamA family radical SAM protein [Parachlamydiaceae bacterium]|nr:KamA family radical SAM protein [Parachlamydiaceae bacterium]